jgi:hypothetical protein
MVSAYAYYPDSIGFVNKPFIHIDVAKVEELSHGNLKISAISARIHPVLKKLLFFLLQAIN